MHLATIFEATAAVVTVLGSVGSLVVVVIVKAERITSAIERMGDKLASVVERVDDHEGRIRDLEK